MNKNISLYKLGFMDKFVFTYISMKVWRGQKLLGVKNKFALTSIMKFEHLLWDSPRFQEKIKQFTSSRNKFRIFPFNSTVNIHPSSQSCPQSPHGAWQTFLLNDRTVGGKRYTPASSRLISFWIKWSMLQFHKPAASCFVLNSSLHKRSKLK